MTVMTYNKSSNLLPRLSSDNQPNIVIGPTQLYVVALLVVLALALALTLLFALPTVESWRFGNFQILPNDFAHFAMRTI
jgi:hypothetical protein